MNMVLNEGHDDGRIAVTHWACGTRPIGEGCCACKPHEGCPEAGKRIIHREGYDVEEQDF